LSVVGEELTTNYLSHIHLIVAFLPSLQAQSSPTSLIFTTSGLALIPIARCPNYCASKAAMHHLILTLREQLDGSNVKVIEILPPAVQTELHDKKNQPDLENGGSFGMPIAEFTDEAWRGLESGETDIPVGRSKGSYEGWEAVRQGEFRKMADMIKKRK
jgi:short-subunit dehydrogenase involved in D-alanine esterification of teichoic acids